MRIIFTITAIALLAGCQQSLPPVPAPAAEASMPPSNTKLGNKGDFTDAQICRAAVAALMGQDASIIRATTAPDGLVATSYKRPSDGKVWKNRCKLEGGRVAWTSETGRWRVGPDDEVVSFAVDDDSLTITQTFSDGSNTSDTFELRSL